MMKLWIYENHICELRSEELNEGWSSQLYTQLLQLRKESLKKKIKGSNPVQAWIFYHFIFVLFLYFFYHSSCRKDQFTVLSLKFSDL